MVTSPCSCQELVIPQLHCDRQNCLTKTIPVQTLVLLSCPSRSCGLLGLTEPSHFILYRCLNQKDVLQSSTQLYMRFLVFQHRQLQLEAKWMVNEWILAPCLCLFLLDYTHLQYLKVYHIRLQSVWIVIIISDTLYTVSINNYLQQIQSLFCLFSPKV